MASKIFFSHQKVYFWISAFDHRAIVLDKMHIVHWHRTIVKIELLGLFLKRSKMFDKKSTEKFSLRKN